jgi:hypothetical protein
VLGWLWLSVFLGLLSCYWLHYYEKKKAAAEMRVFAGLSCYLLPLLL